MSAAVLTSDNVMVATGATTVPSVPDGAVLVVGGARDAPRGVVASKPGLYFVGMPLQFGLTSQLLGGVKRDADYVVARIVVLQRANTHAGESANALP